MAEYNDYIPPEENPGDIPQSTIGPLDSTDERLYWTRLTPKTYPWGFSVGDDWGWGCGHEVGFGWGLGSLVHAVSHFASNAVAVAGKAIDTVAAPVSVVAKGVGSVVAKVPIVGGPVSSVFSSAWSLATSPLNAVMAIAHGERIDHAILSRLEQNLQNVKDIAQYASVVTSMVPGVGTGISAAIGAGSALMNGQPIDEALMAGVKSAVPGGPLAAAALDVGYQGIHAAATHAKFDVEGAAKTGLGAAAQSLGLPPAGTNALMAGVTMASQIAQGAPPEKAITDNAIAALPLPADQKTAMHQANDLVHELAAGHPVDQALLKRSDMILGYLPVSEGVKQQVRDAAAGKVPMMPTMPSMPGMPPVMHHGFGAALPGLSPEILSTALKVGLADKLISSSGIPPAAHSALTTGLALGTAKLKQAQRQHELAHHAIGKLVESGIQLSKAVPSVGEGRRLVGAGHKGFDLGHGILGMRASLFDISSTRNLLTHPDDLKGFDMAVAQKIGLVTTKADPKLSHAARAGYSMTVGMQGYHPQNKMAMMHAIQTHPSASVGAKVAVHQIVQSREGFLARLLHFLFGKRSH